MQLMIQCTISQQEISVQILQLHLYVYYLCSRSLRNKGWLICFTVMINVKVRHLES